MKYADDRARDFSRRCGHLSGGAAALAANAGAEAAPDSRRLGYPSRWVAGRPGQDRQKGRRRAGALTHGGELTPGGGGTDDRRGTDDWRRGY